MTTTRDLLIPGTPGAGAHGAPGSAQVLRLPPDGGLSDRGRRIAWVLAASLLLGGAGTLAAFGITPVVGATAGAGAPRTASAAPVVGDTLTDQTGEDGAIEAVWDGPTTHLDWTGREYVTAEATFIGDRVASPGDVVRRTLRLRNAGPSGAVLTVDLALDAEVGAAGGVPGTLPGGTAGAALADSVELFWDAGGIAGQERFSTLLEQGREPVLAEVQVESGEEITVELGFTMPEDAAQVQRVDGLSGQFAFQVRAHMSGGEPDVEDPATPDPEVPAPGVPDPVDPDLVDPGPADPDTAGPDPAAPAPADTGAAPPTAAPSLAVTGAQALGVAAVAAGLLGLGWLLLAAARRRRSACAECARRPGRGEIRVEHRAVDGARRIWCADCAVVVLAGEVDPLDDTSAGALVGAGFHSGAGGSSSSL